MCKGLLGRRKSGYQALFDKVRAQVAAIEVDALPLSDDPDARRLRLTDEQTKVKGFVTHWITK